MNIQKRKSQKFVAALHLCIEPILNIVHFMNLI
jgi:hypothetical protein